MRERAQASVETIALTAAAVALATALLLGVVRLAPPLASGIGQALSHVFAPSQPKAPGLDGLERLLLSGATSPDDDGPTLLDLRVHLRSRLDRPSADAAFAAILRPLVEAALAPRSIDSRGSDVTIVDRAAEDAWLHHRFYPGRWKSSVELGIELMGTPGGIIGLAHDLGLGADEPVDGIAPGHAAGDVVVRLAGGWRELILRRRPGSGLSVIADLVQPRRGTTVVTGVHGQASVEYAGLLALAAVLGATLALIAGPPLVHAVRNALTAVLTSHAHRTAPGLRVPPTSPTSSRHSGRAMRR